MLRGKGEKPLPEEPEDLIAMKKEDYSDYYISDLLRDLGRDFDYVKEKIRLFLKLKRYFSLVQTVWSYVTAVLFAVYGIRWFVLTGDPVLPSVIWSVSALYAGVTTVLLVSGGEDRERKKRLKTVRRIFKYVSFAVRLVILGLAMGMLARGNESFGATVALGVFTVAWMTLSVAADVAVFFVNRTLGMLRELAEREVERTKAAFRNTAGAASGGVSGLAGTAKRLFGGLFGGRDGDSGSGNSGGDPEDPFGI